MNWCIRALQDSKVTAGLKKMPGVPLLYIIVNTIVLDKPHQTSLDHVQAVQLGELVSSAQKESIRSLKEEQGIGQKDGERRGRKRKRKQSNPNPLSCLKKKKKGVPTPPKKTEEGEKKKRSRHRRQKGELLAPVVTSASWEGLQPLGFFSCCLKMSKIFTIDLFIHLKQIPIIYFLLVFFM